MGKWVHRLSEVDKEALTALCENCGPTRLRIKPSSRPGKVIYRCAVGANMHRGGKGRKRTYRKNLQAVCSRCEFVPEDRCQLDVHHKDGNHNNNEKSNLQTLCANCHRLQHKGL